MAELNQPLLILVAGPTGAGKSTVIDFIRRGYQTSVYVGAKLTTRPPRANDNAFDLKCVDEIPARFAEFAYKSVGWQYAINVDEVTHALERGLSYLVTCTDPGTTQELRQLFPLVVLYVYRPIAPEAFADLMRARETTNSAELAARREEIDAAVRTYAQNIDLYDFVLLNTEGFEVTGQQIENALGKFGLMPDGRGENIT